MDHQPPPFFKRGPAPLAQLAFYAALSIALIFVDSRFQTLELLRQGISLFTRPVQQTPDMIAQHELLDRVADLVDEGRLHTTVTRTLTPINAATLRQAHELVESERTVGKVVVADWEQ